MDFRCEWTRGLSAREAIDVRRRVYTEEFGFDLGETAVDEFDERAYHLLATTTSGEPVASLRLIDSPERPFEIERFLDLTPYLGPTWHPAEITRLCILAPFRRITRAAFVHLVLLEGVLRLTLRLGVTHVVASSRDDLMPVYQYLLFDTYQHVTYQHPEIGDAKHTLMSLDLETFPERCRRARPTLYRAVEAALAHNREEQA